MYILENSHYFYLLLLLVVLLVSYIRLLYWKKKTQREFASAKILSYLSPESSIKRQTFKFILWMLCITSIILALVNLKMGTKMTTVKREGVDIVFAIDVSKSMDAEDVAPNRIERSKYLVSKTINMLTADRIGLIVYAAQAYPQLPITTDYGAAKMFLQSINTDIMSSQGTSINEAINMAGTFFDNLAQTNKILVIVSDGEDHSEKTIDAINVAVKNNIRVFTIGVGTSKGSPIPIRANRSSYVSYKKDRKGDIVISKLNNKILKEISQNGNGRYLNGNNTEETLNQIKQILQESDKKLFEAKQISEYQDQFQWFIGFSVLLMIVNMVLSERKKHLKS